MLIAHHPTPPPTHRVKEVVGYDPADFVGTTMSDYFHPGDCKKMINCEKACESTV